MNMNRLFSAFLVGILTLFAFTRVAAAGTCRMEILVDHSGSMAAQRSDGVLKADGTAPTRCYAAGLAVQELLQAYLQGDAYDIKKVDDTGIVVSSTDVYDTTCPNVADRLVSILVFTEIANNDPKTFDHLTVTPDSPDGFVSPLRAFTLWQSSKYWHIDAAKKISEPTESCEGVTPLAQAMCITAGDFPAGLPAPGNVRQAMFLTDGGENASELPGCRDGNTDPLDPGAPGSAGWGDRVTAQLLARGIEGHGFLFMEGAQSLTATAARRSPASVETLGGRVFPTASSANTLQAAPITTDQVFLQDMANRTGGKLSVVPDNLLIAPSATLLDTDGDGVPDFRDFCPFGTCVDTDRDQIPDSMDACVISQFEDGNGPFPADGCSDFDSDGVRDGIDQCPTSLEDWYPPKPNDGCPRAPAAAPAMPGALLGLLGFGVLGLGIVQARRSGRFAREG